MVKGVVNTQAQLDNTPRISERKEQDQGWLELYSIVLSWTAELSRSQQKEKPDQWTRETASRWIGGAWSSDGFMHLLLLYPNVEDY